MIVTVASKVRKLVRLPTVFSRVCLLWTLYSQALLMIGLWHVESDVPELFGSPLLDRVFWRLSTPIGLGTLGLTALGVLLTLLYVVKQRGLGRDAVRTLSGLGYLTLTFVAAALIWRSLPELYAPPPGLPQFLRLGVVIALDVAYVTVVRRIQISVQ